jgi:hypothetical protein
MTNLATDLAACVEALQKATPGEWFGKQATVYMHLRAKGDKYGDPYIMEAGQRGQVLSSHDARAIAAAVNFLRTHAPAIAELQARCEAAERDAERYRWLRLRLAAEELDSEDAALIALRMVGPIGHRPADPDYNGELDAAIDASREVGNG